MRAKKHQQLRAAYWAFNAILEEDHHMCGIYDQRVNHCTCGKYVRDRQIEYALAQLDEIKGVRV